MVSLVETVEFTGVLIDAGELDLTTARHVTGPNGDTETTNHKQ